MNKFKMFTALLSFVFAISITVSAQTAVFTTLGGEKFDLDQEQGKVVVLAIGATWLPLSVQQSEILNKLSKKYANRDVVFFFVAADSTSAKSKNYASNQEIGKFAKDNGLSAAVLRDPDGLVSLKSFGIDQIPSLVILDKRGVVSGEPFGGLDPGIDVSIPMAKVIDRLL